MQHLEVLIPVVGFRPTACGRALLEGFLGAGGIAKDGHGGNRGYGTGTRAQRRRKEGMAWNR